MSDPLLSGLSRRRFLAGSGFVAGAAVLGACGGGDKKVASAGTASTTSKYVLAQFFGSGQFAAGSPLRAPFGLADSQGLLLTKDTPAQLEVEILDASDKRVGSPLTLQRRAKGLPRPYFALEATIPTAGIYTMRVQKGIAAGNEMSFEVTDPKDLTLIRPGLALPPLETPTTADARGVKPICTRTPVCPLHDVTLAQALATKKPVGLIIASPAFCKVSICGPVLDVVLGAASRYPAVKLLHAEVYADPFTTLDNYSPTLLALGLQFEPCLVLAGPDGKVVQRLDSIFDEDDLDGALKSLTA